MEAITRRGAIVDKNETSTFGNEHNTPLGIGRNRLKTVNFMDENRQRKKRVPGNESCPSLNFPTKTAK